MRITLELIELILFKLLEHDTSDLSFLQRNMQVSIRFSIDSLFFAPGIVLTNVSLTKPQVRQGVALLWLDSGSWASAIVLSEEGHLLTCAHLLTAVSWMELGGGSDRVMGGFFRVKLQVKIATQQGPAMKQMGIARSTFQLGYRMLKVGNQEEFWGN